MASKSKMHASERVRNYLSLSQQTATFPQTDQHSLRNRLTKEITDRSIHARAEFVKFWINRSKLEQFFPITAYPFPDIANAHRGAIVRLPAGVHLRLIRNLRRAPRLPTCPASFFGKRGRNVRNYCGTRGGSTRLTCVSLPVCPITITHIYPNW